MEWVKVSHPRTRDVFVDGKRSGETGVVLIVAEGTHRFDLGKPVDYSPKSRKIAVTGTSALNPLLIAFS